MDVGKALAIGTGVVLGAAATSAVALAVWLHDPIDTPEHVARECQVVAAIERQRLFGADERVAAQPMMWRRAEAVEGAPGRPRGEGHSLKVKAIGALFELARPRRAGAIDCDAALDQASVPHSVGNRAGVPEEQLSVLGRVRYSRVAFLPGGRYALMSTTHCEVERDRDLVWTGWDQKTKTEIWMRQGQQWREAESLPVHLLAYSPEHKLPARCFSPGYAEERP
ncbi:hypothetical protein [Caulobacter endophyticus]|uniref:hypothetical protein n=1 Tax=Caulobacter endophyticus TaxID=2172652 RepID=UPI00240FDE87|nr:hypothetical protein [Caulobacter endophyticus]MDG2529735.1 hypothetical protein [Caulobacter endophyticus]